jgi:hypothetical protein
MAFGGYRHKVGEVRTLTELIVRDRSVKRLMKCGPEKVHY